MTRPIPIVAGFMPLLDSALLVAAAARGFAKAKGIDLPLVRETSWAAIRDRMAVGQFQAAHMLGPMPIACNLGLAPLAAPTIVPMALGLGGNAVTVSNALWAAMADNGATGDLDPAGTGTALARVIAAGCRPRLAVVHPRIRAMVMNCDTGPPPAASMQERSRSSRCHCS